MPASELSKQQEPSREQQEQDQHPSSRSFLLVRADGMITRVQSTSGKADSPMPRRRSNDEKDILRFRESERLLHWAIALPFMICWITALILVLVYNSDPTRPYRIVFAATHRVAGVCLVLLPIVSLFIKRGDFRTHVYNIKDAWLWSWDDLKWLFLMGCAALNRKIVLPQQGKFNAAEKVNFMVVMVTWPVFAVTGIFMFILDVPWFAWLIHVIAAFLASPTMLGHIYMATVNPTTRTGLSGMVSGYVNRHWAKHHYARWYDEEFEHPQTRDNTRPNAKK